MAEWASPRPRFGKCGPTTCSTAGAQAHWLNGSVFLNAKTIEYRRTDTIVGDNRYD